MGVFRHLLLPVLVLHVLLFFNARSQRVLDRIWQRQRPFAPVVVVFPPLVLELGDVHPNEQQVKRRA